MLTRIFSSSLSWEASDRLRFGQKTLPALAALTLLFAFLSLEDGGRWQAIALFVLAALQVGLFRSVKLRGEVGALIAANFSLLLFSCEAGSRYRFQDLFLGLAAIPVLIFGRTELRKVRGMIAISLAGFLIVEILTVSGSTGMILDSRWVGLTYWLLLPLGFGFPIVSAYYLVRLNERSQARVNLMLSELRESDRTSRALLAAIPDMIFRVSSEGRFLDYHCHSEKDLFLPPEKLVGKKVNEVLPQEVARRAIVLVTEAISRGTGSDQGVQVFEFEFVQTGRKRWLETRVVASGPDDALMIVQDISARKEAERTILEQRSKAEAASKMAALGEMAGGLAHEINNPLAIIHGKAQQLREMAELGELDQTTLQSVVEKIESTSMRISRIVRSLRTIARDGAKDPLERASVRSIIEDTLELCRERFVSHQVQLRVNPISDLLDIQCRPVQIAQVLLNLLNNAHDAVEKLPEKWIELDVSLDSFSDGQESIRISVTDSGNGIPEELREKVLQPFFTTKGVGKGTGLGLSISKGIVEDHKGLLLLDASSANTRFVVHLPRHL